MGRYEAFLPEGGPVQVGEERILVLRDLAPGRARYAARCARVRLLAPDDPAGVDGELQLRSRTGQPLAGRWRIRVLEELPGLVPGEPYGDVHRALDRAAGGASPRTGADGGGPPS